MEKGDTRERIIQAARKLFWEHGFANTAVADILEEANARSGSFYYFFESKQALLNAVLDFYLEALEPEVVTPAFARTADPIGRVMAILERYRQALIATNFTYGCPIGKLSLEVPPDQKKTLGKIDANFRAWIAVVQRCLEAAADRFLPATDLHELACFVLTVMEGAVMQSRVQRSIDPFDKSVRQLRRHIDLLLKKNKK